MKALWIEAPGNVHYGDLSDPKPEKNWVKVKVKAACVCGSDLKVYKFGRAYEAHQRVSGHEFVGIIEEVANESSPWKVGQRVCAYPQIYCGVCDECKAGHFNTCKDRKFIGGRHYNGGFADYMVLPESTLLDVPENISDIEAAMTEPFAVGLHAVNQAGGAALKDKSIVIYGAGPIGLFALEAAKHYGVKQIIMLDMVQDRLDLAKAHGATDVIPGNDTPEALQAKVKKLTGGAGVDAVIDAVCLGVTVNNGMRFLKPHGMLSVVGLAKPTFEIDFQYLVCNEITIRGSYTYLAEMRDCLEIMGSGTVDTSYIANPIVPLSQGVEAFKKLAEKPEECIKVVFIPEE